MHTRKTIHTTTVPARRIKMPDRGVTSRSSAAAGTGRRSAAIASGQACRAVATCGTETPVMLHCWLASQCHPPLTTHLGSSKCCASKAVVCRVQLVGLDTTVVFQTLESKQSKRRAFATFVNLSKLLRDENPTRSPRFQLAAPLNPHLCSIV